MQKSIRWLHSSARGGLWSPTAEQRRFGAKIKMENDNEK